MKRDKRKEAKQIATLWIGIWAVIAMAVIGACFGDMPGMVIGGWIIIGVVNYCMWGKVMKDIDKMVKK